MTLRRQSTSSSFIDINDPQSLDYLFQTNAVSDIRSVHLRIRNDVEAKKKELRGLVGDRYKDVLHASDSISLMKSTVAEVQNKMEMLENVLKFEEIRDQNESSQSGLRESSLNHSSGNGRASDDKIYILSTQLHLLVSIPEQIYNAVESNDYLRAAQVFLVGRLLYKKLQSGNTGDENVMAQFPIIQRQWDTISHLRGLIVTKVSKFLEGSTEDYMGTLKSLLAVHLLDSQSTFSTCLQKLLESRTKAINRILSTSSTLQASKDTKPTESVTRVLCELTNIVMKTLQEVHLLFISPSSTPSSSHVSNESDSKQPLIQSYITKHTRSNPPSRTPSTQLNFDTSNPCSNSDNVSSANKEFRQTLSPLLKLFSSILNIHLYHRYLPPQIQNFNPLTTLIHRRLKKSEQGSQGPIEHEFNDIVKEMVKNWVNEIEKLVAGNVDGVVGGLHNGGDIVEVEREVKEWIYTMETKNGHDSQWNMVLSSLLPSYSIYETLIYPSLFNRSTQIIESALSKLSTFHSTMYIPLSLADLLTNPNSPLQHYTSNQDKKFVWDVLSQLSPSQQQAVLFGWDWTRSIQSQSQTLSRRQTLLSPLMGKETDKWMGTELERIESKLYHPIVMMLVEEFHIMVNEIQQSIGDLIFVSSKSSNHEPTIAKPLNSKSLRNDAKSVYESELVKRFQEFCKHLSNRCQIETPHLACTIFVSHFTKTLLTHSRSLQLLSSSLPQPNSSGLNPPSNDPDNLTKVLKKELSKLYYTVTLAVLNRIVENNVTLLSVSSMKDDSSPVSELKEWAGTEFGEIEIEIEVGNSTTDAKTGGENAEGSGTGVESGTGSGTDKVKQVVELPVSCSIRLIKMLSRVVKDVDRIVGWDCESFILHEFLLGFANSLLSSYKSFATTFTNPSSVSSSPSSLLSSKDLQKLKLQLLFDIDYLTKLFDGVVSRNVSLENLHSRSGFGETDRERSEFGEEDQGVLWLGEGGGDLHGLRMKMYEVKKMGAEVQELVRGLIDPIDFLHFRSHLSGLVDRYYQRTVLMFGVFTVFNSSNDLSKPNVSVLSTSSAMSKIQEPHSVLSLVKNPARFSLIPVQPKQRQPKQLPKEPSKSNDPTNPNKSPISSPVPVSPAKQTSRPTSPSPTQRSPSRQTSLRSKSPLSFLKRSNSNPSSIAALDSSSPSSSPLVSSDSHSSNPLLPTSSTFSTTAILKQELNLTNVQNLMEQGTKATLEFQDKAKEFFDGLGLKSSASGMFRDFFGDVGTSSAGGTTHRYGSQTSVSGSGSGSAVRGKRDLAGLTGSRMSRSGSADDFQKHRIEDGKNSGRDRSVSDMTGRSSPSPSRSKGLPSGKDDVRGSGGD